MNSPQGPTKNQTPTPLPFLPFKVLQSGNVTLVGYLGVLSALAWYGLSLLQEQLYRWSTILLGQFGASQGAVSEARDFLIIIPICIAISIALTAIPLTTRLVWLNGSLPLEPLISRTLPSFQRVIQTLYFSLRRAGYLVIPVVALFTLYHLVIKPNQSPAAILFFYGTCGVVAIIVLIRTVPILCSPIIAVVGQYSGVESLLWSQQIYEGVVNKLLTTIIACGGASVALHLSLHQWRFAWGAISLVEGIFHALVGWYLLTMLSIITATRIGEITTRKAPSPYQKTP